MVKHSSLLEALANCSASCGWCSQHCPDEDKYDMLVACIRFQSEFLLINYTAFKILSGNANRLMNKIMSLIENLFNEMQMNLVKTKHVNLLSEQKSEEVSRLPGCSQIFLISQSLGQMYSKEFQNNDEGPILF